MKWSTLKFRLRQWDIYLGYWLQKAVVQAGRPLGILSMVARLDAVVVRPDGSKENLGLLSSRVVTNAGVTYMRDDFNAATGGADIGNFNYHDCGTNSTAENVTDTALGTPFGGSRVAGTQSAPASNQYRSLATISFTGTLAIVEHGVFSASSSGTLWDRSVFTAINVVNGDAIQFTYTLTITAGG